MGISGFTCRPKQAREKPKVSAFTSAKIDKILELRPDLVIGFSDLQAAIAQDLIRAGVNVMVFNQRSIDEIFEMMLMLARMVAAEAAGVRLAEHLRGELARIAEAAGKFPRRPRVFFEEWADPLISGIRWVDELVEVAGGEPVFPQLREQHSATGRVVTHGGSRGGESGCGDCFVVRKEGQQGTDSRARGLVAGGGRAIGEYLRDQIDVYFTARSGGADGRGATTALDSGAGCGRRAGGGAGTYGEFGCGCGAGSRRRVRLEGLRFWWRAARRRFGGRGGTLLRSAGVRGRCSGLESPGHPLRGAGLRRAWQRRTGFRTAA